MLEDMYKVISRINDIQKKFIQKSNPVSQTSEQNKSFSNTLNEQISNAASTGNIPKENNTDISVSKIKDIANSYAVKRGLPPALVDAVIKVESDYNPKAVSKKGAAGLMQLMPGVIKEMGVSDPFNVEDNIKSGISILKDLMDKYEWDFKKALAAYNAGEKAVDKNNGVPPIKETKEYVKKVIDAYIQNIK
jgi:soluble lytic murein transglycosylase-like protein